MQRQKLYCNSGANWQCRSWSKIFKKLVIGCNKIILLSNQVIVIFKNSFAFLATKNASFSDSCIEGHIQFYKFMIIQYCVIRDTRNFKFLGEPEISCSFCVSQCENIFLLTRYGIDYESKLFFFTGLRDNRENLFIYC